MKSKSCGSYRLHNNDLDSDKDGRTDGATIDPTESDFTMATRTIHVGKDNGEISQFLGLLVEKKAAESIRKSQQFKIGVSGGSLPNFLCEALPTITTEWSKWRVFFCDERLVPFSDPESTYHVYMEKLLGQIPLKDEQIIKINPDLTAANAAKDYAEKITQHFPDEDLPHFDMLLLGMGPDGHTCSLFPAHSLLKEQGLWVASLTDSPKPPPSRITLTLPVINNAASVVFVCTGTNKAETVKEVLEDTTTKLPSALVRPHSGELYWILDKDASQLLSNQ